MEFTIQCNKEVLQYKPKIFSYSGKAGKIDRNEFIRELNKFHSIELHRYAKKLLVESIYKFLATELLGNDSIYTISPEEYEKLEMGLWYYPTARRKSIEYYIQIDEIIKILNQTKSRELNYTIKVKGCQITIYVSEVGASDRGREFRIERARAYTEVLRSLHGYFYIDEKTRLTKRIDMKSDPAEVSLIKQAFNSLKEFVFPDEMSLEDYAKLTITKYHLDMFSGPLHVVYVPVI